MKTAADWFHKIYHANKDRLPWRQLLIVSAISIVISWLMFSPDGLLGKADAVGYAVCHRIDLRSFHFGDRQIPLCARCSGQYLGAVLGLVYLSLYKPRRTGSPSKMIIGTLIVFVLIYALDGINSYIHLLPSLSRFYLYTPSNILRLVTGTGLGLGVSVLLLPAFNETVWNKRSPEPVLEGFRDFGVLLVLAVIVDLLVLIENPIILYPLALVSAGGVLLLLTMVYTMVAILIFRKENSFDNIKQLFFPIIAGFMIALVQVFILDYLRLLLTGTWGGFDFG